MNFLNLVNFRLLNFQIFFMGQIFFNYFKFYIIFILNFIFQFLSFTKFYLFKFNWYKFEFIEFGEFSLDGWRARDVWILFECDRNEFNFPSGDLLSQFLLVKSLR